MKKLDEFVSGEDEWLAKIVDDLLNDKLKLEYSDWLDLHGSSMRSTFLRSFVRKMSSMSKENWPIPKPFISEKWLELIGYHLVTKMVEEEHPELRMPVLRVARPALRFKEKLREDDDIPVGASKAGGLPDLPKDVSWPVGAECTAIYNDETAGVEELAGFLGQINLAEIAHTLAARTLPKSGVLSFFCFQDIENDKPDTIGVKAILLPEPSKLLRTEPQEELLEGNTTMPSRSLDFEETLDVPEDSAGYNDGPWAKELNPNPKKSYESFFDHFRELNFDNILGYARSTTGGDPTPSKQSRHLIVLRNSIGCTVHLQIPADELAKHNFNAITLNWVDFD